MKTTSFFVLFLFATMLNGCAQKSYTAAADQNLSEEINFEEYKTFTWASQVDNMETAPFFLNDIALKAMIRDAVSYEMDSRGYDYVKGDNADLLVNFRVFDEPVEITGLTGLGNGFYGSNEVRSYEERETYKLDKGSIIVQLVDKDSGKVAWQGYVSGITDGDVFDKGEERINTAVSKVFDEYNYRADNL